MKVAVLDLGSSSFRLVVAKGAPGPSIVPLLRKRAPLHLGRVVGSLGCIPEPVATEAVETVRRFRHLAEQAGAKKVITVATSALRDARNAAAIGARITEASGGPVRFLTGHEEAALTFAAMRAAHEIGRKPVLGIDLGGGSLELAVGNDRALEWTASVDLGSSRLAGRFVAHDPPADAERAALAAHVGGVLRPLEAELAAHRPVACIAAGGTVKALARIVVAGRKGSEPVSVGGTVLRARKLTRLADELLTSTHDERLALPGMNPHRADVLGAGAVVLATALAAFGFTQLEVSDWGLREGIILQAVGLAKPARDAQSRPLRFPGTAVGRSPKGRQTAGSRR